MRRFDMKADWDARARENARQAIACDDYQDEATFQASGRRDAAQLLDGLEALLPSQRSVLEIGCGIGRLLEPLATRFRDLYGVDVAQEMIKRGQRRLEHLPQIRFVEIDGTGQLPFEDGSFDFCFSFITFHHIPFKDVVARYIGEARRVLRPAGIFRFHLFGRPEGVRQALRERYTRKSTWRGCKFTLPEILAITQRGGFEIVLSRYVDAYPNQPRPFFGKVKPDAIWITARKPASPP
jgi:SAM-dependent methyltransferase